MYQDHVIQMDSLQVQIQDHVLELKGGNLPGPGPLETGPVLADTVQIQAVAARELVCYCTARFVFFTE